MISPTALLLTGADVIKVDPARPKVEQPIAFPHLTHTEKIGLECKFCHRTVETETFATIPGVSTCIICHSTKITDNPEEEKIREYAKNGEEIPWVQLNKMPPYVYFSHRR
ncbi:MAG: cytochrome c3 family protein, partial [Candidatus Hydrothermarchaeaceae archaeon]